MTDIDPWWVNGTLFENCNCQLLCPAHVSFRQDCHEERCVGYWGIHVDKGRFGRLVVEPQTAAVLYESPRRMHTAGWRVQIFLDSRVSAEQRAAMEQILSGGAGGPWAILAKFFTERLATQAAPIQFVDAGHEKKLTIEGVLDSTLHSVDSKKTGEPATLGNLFNVIHSAVQYMARGSSRVNSTAFAWETAEKHSLYSVFSWAGP
ncbi:MAG: DUF1326 domain-containing protein [Proteobacteria bacterium]|nr:DUF1326 domain-containing protein [Pseudomonadota bacterium]